MGYMSKEGYENLVVELQRLESIERPKALGGYRRGS